MTKNKKTFELSGVGASAGTTYGEARVVYSLDQSVEERSITEAEVDQEISLLNNAVQDALVELEQLKVTAGKKIGGPIARIFDSQIMIAIDPEFLKNVKVKIKSDLKSAGYIYSILVNQTLHRLRNAENQYLRQMVVDIEAVSNRIIRRLTGQVVRHISNSAQDSIFVGQVFTAAEVLTLFERKIRAIVTTEGGSNSHMCLIARSLLIPTIVGVDGAHTKISSGDKLIVDGSKGIVKVNPSIKEWNELRKKKAKVTARQILKLDRLTSIPPITTDSVKVDISANLDLPGPVDQVLSEYEIGIGLFRTEFLYLQNGKFPSAERQFEIYDSIAKRYHPQEVVIRTFDLGSDKYYKNEIASKENNPALGWRGIRAAFDMPAIFRTQIKAILRASSRKNVKILLPMISDISELRKARRSIKRVIGDMIKEGIKIDKDIKIGIMIEVPSAAVLADILAEKADFFSIGSNDLTQYTLAADRDNQKLAKIFNPLHPSVLRMIKLATDAARKNNIPVSMCGEMAGDIIAVPFLMGIGINQLSMNPSKIFNICNLISRIKMSSAVEISNKVMKLKTLKEVENLLFDFNIAL